MSDPRACPMCDCGELVQSEGRLEQCGDTHLPTTVTRCTVCGYASWEPALGVRWKRDGDALPAATPGHRRAA